MKSAIIDGIFLLVCFGGIGIIVTFAGEWSIVGAMIYTVLLGLVWKQWTETSWKKR